MKTVSDDLFRLIKSLNKSEKGFFKKFASKNASGSKQNYIVLFEAIDAQDEYDEEKLKQKLRDPALVKQLPVYKVYLFNLILKALNQYSAYDNTESQLNDMLSGIRILTSKHLYPEALKIIRKAKTLAYKFDKHKFIMELLAAERHILMLRPVKDMLNKRNEIYGLQLDLVERIKEFYTQNMFSDRMTIMVDNQADFRKNEQELEKIISDPAFGSKTTIRGYFAMMNHFHTLLVYSGAKGNNEQILNQLKEQIEFEESHSQFINENPQNYIYLLINYLLYSHYARDAKKISDAKSKLEVIRKKIKGRLPRETEIQILFHASNVEMIIYEKSCDILSGRNKIKQIEQDLKTYGNDVPANVKALMYINISCFSIIDDNFDIALKYLNKVLNSPELTERKDVMQIAKMLELLVHYELNNFDLIEYLLKPAVKFFRSEGKNSTVSKILLKFFAEVITLNKDDHKESFMELVYKLKKVKDPDVLMGFFDFISWAEAHSDNTGLISVLRNKNLK